MQNIAKIFNITFKSSLYSKALGNKTKDSMSGQKYKYFKSKKISNSPRRAQSKKFLCLASIINAKNLILQPKKDY